MKGGLRKGGVQCPPPRRTPRCWGIWGEGRGGRTPKLTRDDGPMRFVAAALARLVVVVLVITEALRGG